MKLSKYGLTIELKENFTQAQYEIYQTEFMEAVKDKRIVSVAERSIVQAAVTSKILTGIEKDLLEYPPRVIKWLTTVTNDFINKQVEQAEE